MLSKRNLKPILYVLLIVLFYALFTGCAGKKPFWGDVKSGLILQYNMPKDQQLNYQFSSHILQTLEVMGQAMENSIKLAMEFSAKSEGMNDGNYQLMFTIDSSKVDVETPRGNLAPDMSSVFGKSFEMVLSPLGKELDLSGEEKLTYIMGQEGERSLGSNFQTIFPDLAGKPIKIGDKWTTLDTITVDEGGVKIVMTFNSENTLAGLETIDGVECAKITVKSTGKMEGEGEQRGAALDFEGDLKSDDVWYFAYKKGIFTKSISNGTTEATIAVSGPQNMTIPMTMETKFEVKLVQ